MPRTPLTARIHTNCGPVGKREGKRESPPSEEDERRLFQLAKPFMNPTCIMTEIEGVMQGPTPRYLVNFFTTLVGEGDMHPLFVIQYLHDNDKKNRHELTKEDLRALNKRRQTLGDDMSGILLPVYGDNHWEVKSIKGYITLGGENYYLVEWESIWVEERYMDRKLLRTYLGST